MLTIQPKLLNTYRPAFKASEDTAAISLAEMDDDTYEQQKQELEDVSDNLKDMLDEDKLPKLVKTLIKGSVFLTSVLLAGMATGWGTKKTIEGSSKLMKSSAVQNLKHQAINAKNKIFNTAKKVKTNIIQSNIYTKTTNAIKNAYAKFGEKKLGKPIVKFLNKTAGIVKSVYNKITGGTNYVVNKVKGIKKETWEKATVNTVGASGGIATGVNTLQAKKEDE